MLLSNALKQLPEPTSFHIIDGRSLNSTYSEIIVVATDWANKVLHQPDGI